MEPEQKSKKTEQALNGGGKLFVDSMPGLRVRVVHGNTLTAAAILRKAGYTVELARDGAEAVAAAESSEFDLVLMDVRLPVLDGLAATAAIRQLPGIHGRVPIIAMTASAMPGDAETCITAGMDGYLAKPLDRLQMLVSN